jgi:hypothetical protein
MGRIFPSFPVSSEQTGMGIRRMALSKAERFPCVSWINDAKPLPVSSWNVIP